MIGGLQTLWWFLLALVILVTFHEFGHFYIARLCGVKVLRFSVGFGKPIWSRTDKHGTEFALAAIPLGGYVKMVDEREGEVAEQDLPFAFNRKNVWQRIAIVAAGPIANFILAIVLFWALLLPGKIDLVPIVGAVTEDSIAAKAGIEAGQEIVAIDGVPTSTRQAVLRQLIERLGESGSITFSVKYSNSDYVYTSEAALSEWLRGVDEPDPLAGMGLEFKMPPIIVGQVIPDGPGDKAGFLTGDLIVGVDGHSVEGWSEWADYVSQRPGVIIDTEVERNGEVVTLSVTPVAKDVEGKTLGRVELGGVPDEAYIRRYHYSVVEAFAEAVKETNNTIMFVLTSVKKLLFGEISTKNLSGPITIAKVAGSSAESGWMGFLGFLALLSVSLGVFNLLPIPVLDGGHLLYFFVEAIKGSPVSEKIQMVGYQVGLFLVVGLMVVALYNDVLRL